MTGVGVDGVHCYGLTRLMRGLEISFQRPTGCMDHTAAQKARRISIYSCQRMTINVVWHIRNVKETTHIAVHANLSIWCV